MLIDRIMMNESINEWMVEVFCSDAANEAMDEWQLAQGSTQPRVTQSRQTNHCALQIIVQGRTKFSVQPVWSKGAHALKLLQTFYITRQNQVLSAEKRIHTICRNLSRPRLEACAFFSTKLPLTETMARD